MYIRLLGAELGYLKTEDMEEMVNSAGKMFENLLKMLPKDASIELLLLTVRIEQKSST